MAKTIQAQSGMWLYDGSTFCKIIRLANEDDASKWSEVSNEFYEQINPPQVVESIDDDEKNALERANRSQEPERDAAPNQIEDVQPIE